MHKLKLDLESIAVESFEAQPDGEGRPAGTVRAHAEPELLARTLPLSDCLWSACQTCGIYC